jgi:hypothetical protein
MEAQMEAHGSRGVANGIGVVELWRGVDAHGRGCLS